MPWPQNSPIVVDRATRRVVYTPMFKAFEHWSRFARPGAVVLRATGTADALALVTPERQLVVELLNPSATERTIRVKRGERAWDAVLPPRSFGTLTVAAD